jgi:hypothetical protein
MRRLGMSGRATDGAGTAENYGSAMERRPRVLMDMSPGVLRDLLTADLEFTGFDVRIGRMGDADVFVTDSGSRRRGRGLTVRLGTEISVQGPEGIWWFPRTEIDRLADVLHTELRRTRKAA